MGQLVFILGRSGTGKSFSMRNFPPKKYAVVNVQGKILPFRGAAQIEQTAVDQSDKIVKALEIYAKDYKTIVVDDYQYVMSNEFMRRSTERGFDKFTDIGRHAWDIANTVRDLPADVIVYVMCHVDRDDEGNEKIKTIGKLLDEKICLEGMSTIVLKTNVTDGVYSFLTQNNGRDTTKSPHGMFPSYAIENDLYYVDQKIRNYYGYSGSLTDEEMAEIDEAAKKDDIPIGDGKKTRGRRSAKKEEPENASQEEKKEETKKRRRSTKADNNDSESVSEQSTAEDVSEGMVDETMSDVDGEESVSPEKVEKPKSRRRKVQEGDATGDSETMGTLPSRTREEVAAANDERIANAGIDLDDEREEVPFDEAPEPPAAEKLPRKRRKDRSEEEATMNAPEPTEATTEEAAPRRRRRRG